MINSDIPEEKNIILEPEKFSSPAPTPGRKYVIDKTNLIIFTLTFIIVCSAVFLTRYYYLPINILSRSIYKSSKLTTLDFDGNAKVNLNGDFSKASDLLPNRYNLTADFTGSVNLFYERNPKLASNIEVVAQNLFSVNLETRFVDSTLYLNIKDIPDFGLPNSNSFINQWITFGQDRFKVDKTFSNILSELPKDTKSSEIIKRISRESDVVVNDANTFHIRSTFDKDKLFNLMIKLANTSNFKNFDEGDLKTLTKYKDKAVLGDVEFFIDKKTSYLRKVTIPITVFGDLQTGQKIDLNSEIEFKNFNKGSDISKPLSSKSIEEVVSVYEQIMDDSYKSPK